MSETSHASGYGSRRGERKSISYFTPHLPSRPSVDRTHDTEQHFFFRFGCSAGGKTKADMRSEVLHLVLFCLNIPPEVTCLWKRCISLPVTNSSSNSSPVSSSPPPSMHSLRSATSCLNQIAVIQTYPVQLWKVSHFKIIT